MTKQSRQSYIGLVAGWIAAKFVTKYGMGIVGDVIVGVIGAYIGNWLARG